PENDASRARDACRGCASAGGRTHVERYGEEEPSSDGRDESDRATTLSRCGDLASAAARRTSGTVGDQPESDAVARGVRTVSRAAAAVAVAGAAVVADMDRDGPGRVATLARCNLSRPVIGRA